MVGVSLRDHFKFLGPSCVIYGTGELRKHLTFGVHADNHREYTSAIEHGCTPKEGVRGLWSIRLNVVNRNLSDNVSETDTVREKHTVTKKSRGNHMWHQYR